MPPSLATEKLPVKALYIPLADHYAALVAYERYRDTMTHAQFELKQMPNWDLLRAYFQEGNADIAFVMSPLAMDMYHEKPHFKWIGLLHRDGNAFAVNDTIQRLLPTPPTRQMRKPEAKLAQTLHTLHEQTGHPIEIGVPHTLSTHAVVLYRYLQEHDLSLGLNHLSSSEALAITVAPPKSPAFIRSKENKALPAGVEQSLPWADIIESEGYGHIAWYSKDVMPWKDGHVECIAIATDQGLTKKNRAIKEVMDTIHRAGQDIEFARQKGGKALENIIQIIQKHIPSHTNKAIKASLDPTLNVINYENLHIDKPGLKLIMDWAIKGEILKNPIDIDSFASPEFIDISRGRHE